MNSKKRKQHIILLCAACVLQIIGMGLYAGCSIGGYYNDFSALAICLSVISMGIGSYVLVIKSEKDSRFRVLQIVAVGCTMGAFSKVLIDRVFSFAILLGSNLEATNQEAYVRLYISIGAMIAIFLSTIVQIVSCFTTAGKEAE